MNSFLQFVKKNIINHRRALHIGVPILVISMIIFIASEELHSLSIAKSIILLRHMDRHLLLFLFLSGNLAVASMLPYDFIIAKELKIKIHWLKLMKLSWIANTFGIFLGFAGLAGMAMRSLLYTTSGSSGKKMLRMIFFLNCSMAIGLSFLAFLTEVGILENKISFPLNGGLHWLLLAFAAFIPVYFVAFNSNLIPLSGVLNIFRKTDEFPLKMQLQLAAASITEWIAAGMFYWVICTIFMDSFTISAALFVFTVSMIMGIISMVPGGFGSFDLTSTALLITHGFDGSSALAVVMLFRLFYFFLPWIIGLSFSATELKNINDKKLESLTSFFNKTFGVWKKIINFGYKIRFVAGASLWALAVLVFSSGIVLLASASTPDLLERIQLMEHLVTKTTMQFSAQLSVIVGIVLIVLSRQILLRVKKAYYVTIIMLISGAAFTFFKGMDIEEAIILIAVAILLWFSKESFHRDSAPLSHIETAIWLSITLTITIIYWYIGMESSHIMQNLNLELRLVNDFSQLGWISLGFGFSWGLILWATYSVDSTRVHPGIEAIHVTDSFLENNLTDANIHLVRLRDKSIFRPYNNKMIIPYAQQSKILIALGDPHGNNDYFLETVHDFQEFADKSGLKTAFYQVASDKLALYHDLGYLFFKLGEEAIIDLVDFNMQGQSKQNLRTSRSRFYRDGCTIEFLSPPYSDDLIQEMKTVSDIWLKNKKEMGFSLGWFSPDYLQDSPIVTARNKERDMIAFVSIMPSYNNTSAAVDLMRRLPDTNRSLMDTMFTEIILHYQEAGIKKLHIGMAPLAGVGENTFAFRQEKMARYLYEYGNFFYGFDGLRSFKEKFSPNWEPRYLAYHHSLKLVPTLVEIRLLIQNSPTRTMKRERASLR